MIRPSSTRIALLALVTLLLFACGDKDADLLSPILKLSEPLEESVEEVTEPLLEGDLTELIGGVATAVVNPGLTRPLGLLPLKRNSAQSGSTTVTEIVGPAGGVLRAGGMEFRIPAGALAEPVEISMTIPSGIFAEVRFAPRGLEFAVPTSWVTGYDVLTPEADAELYGVHFSGPLGKDPVDAIELLPVVLGPDGFRVDIDHFSGYVLARGR